MPGQWDTQEQLTILLKAVELPSLSDAKAKEIEASWTGTPKRTARSIRDQYNALRKLNQKMRQGSSALPARPSTKGVFGNTPTTKAVGKTKSGRKGGIKRKNPTSDDEDSDVVSLDSNDGGKATRPKAMERRVRPKILTYKDESDDGNGSNQADTSEYGDRRTPTTKTEEVDRAQSGWRSALGGELDEED